MNSVMNIINANPLLAGTVSALKSHQAQSGQIHTYITCNTMSMYIVYRFVQFIHSCVYSTHSEIFFALALLTFVVVLLQIW